MEDSLETEASLERIEIELSLERMLGSLEIFSEEITALDSSLE